MHLMHPAHINLSDNLGNPPINISRDKPKNDAPDIQYLNAVINCHPALWLGHELEHPSAYAGAR